MCQIVILEKSREEIETPRQLLSFYPELKLIKNEMYDKIDLDSCLCTVELEETFDNGGIEWECCCMTYTIKESI
jgi:hypothetical protein